ncbi:hypothetical protein [Arthrobacter caoxuetaonis]|uniref:Uncharacterized protein n=1 Tax=Arthrobacter caoxuetaonis TaxID=2886935 RepID=A0A9X1MGU8_9MICC|nr:hypothetical protein [Arthrobacter caoxuetaonis]MCC3299356.1 hypothetical protein [Arthrobacter caoxuetaonis]USQ59151.1 hypothetical protein NF551_18770 [Arthrobacter caoxuetaonis]
MTPDLLVIDLSARDGLFIALLAFAVALLPVIAAVAVFPFGEKGWYKSKRLLVSIGCLGLAGAFIAGGISFLQEWQENPEPDAGHSGIVQDWAENTYGVTVSDDEADAMARAIRNASSSASETFVVEGASGVIEVKLVQAGDASFRMVQAAAELPLAEGQN